MKKIHKHLDKLTVFVIIIIFYLYNLNRINYGLPFFINLDEINFQYSSLSYLHFITGYGSTPGDPFLAPLLNLILILKYIFFNELILNYLGPEQIKSKIYFNPELFIFYGRLASLTVTSFSIFILYLIFKKFKVSFYFYILILLSFSTSLLAYDISTINGKNSFYLFFFLVQLYFFSKYLLKTHKFNFNAYLIFGFLASLAWGVNYWPAFVSFYAVLALHIRKFKFENLNYLLTFLIIFLIFGPIMNFIISKDSVFNHVFRFQTESQEITYLSFLLNNMIGQALAGLKILFSEKNFFLLLGFLPIFLLHKYTNYKKEFLIIFLILLEPIIIFALARGATPQLRYFGGSICIILILTTILFNELKKTNFRYLSLIFIIINFFVIFNNISLNNKIDSITKEHSFYKFNQNIDVDRSKILYLVDLGFQESLEQNQLYIKLYENNLVKNSSMQKDFIRLINNKIKKINDSKDLIIDNQEIKKDIIYYNYTYLEINNFELFFDFIKKDFDYVVIEESLPFYLTDDILHKEIKEYVQSNFELEKKQFTEEKIYFRSLRSLINYHNNTLNALDFDENLDNLNLDKVYGNNYSLYKLN